MSKIADLKKQILQARSDKDAKKEMGLTKELMSLQRSKQKPMTVQEAYAQLADSP